MDELKILVEMVASLPSLAVWFLVAFYVYKVAVIGSIYGVIRFCVSKFVEWKTMPPAPKQFTLNGLTINENVSNLLLGQVSRLVSTSYIHSGDVAKLKAAIDVIEGMKK